MTGSQAGNSTEQATSQLRDMILFQELLPGQHIRQGALAEVLGLSRSPLREALSALETEGLISHHPNQGYFVSRFSTQELDQVFLMRGLLETAILRSIEGATPEALGEMTEANSELADALDNGPVSAVLQANRRFHFAMFALSPLDLVVAQVGRLWNLSESYRALYLALPSSDTRNRILEEHAQLITELARGNLEEVVRIANGHRDAGQAIMVRLLSGDISRVARR